MPTTPEHHEFDSASSFDLAGCELSFECPMEWDDLRQTDSEDVRHCTTCKKPVTFCSSREAFLKLAARGECVAFFRETPDQVVRLLGNPARGDKLRKYLDDL